MIFGGMGGRNSGYQGVKGLYGVVMGGSPQGLASLAALAVAGHEGSLLGLPDDPPDACADEPGLIAIARQVARHRTGERRRADVAIVCAAAPLPQARRDAGLYPWAGRIAEVLRPIIHPRTTIVVKTAVPPGGCRALAEALERIDYQGRIRGIAHQVELLRPGHTLVDALCATHLAFGSDDPHLVERLAAIYAGLRLPVRGITLRGSELLGQAAQPLLASGRANDLWDTPALQALLKLPAPPPSAAFQTERRHAIMRA